MDTGLIEVYRSLQQGTPSVVATIIDSRGSVPRKTGSKIIVFENGRTVGTIGGGAIEGDVIQRARAVFNTKRGDIASYDLRKNGASEDLDLICGGHMDVMLEYVNADKENLLLYAEACRKMANEQSFFWKAVITRQDIGIVLERCILDAKDAGKNQRLNSLMYQSRDRRVFIESVSPAQTAFIVGAGHVSREIAQLAKQIGMKTQVFDDRAAFASRSRFPEADGIHVCPDYADIFKPFNITENSYIIIVTRGHSYDEQALGQALKTGAGYIGMMGSRKKRDTIFKKLIAKGHDKQELARVHCPIGLPIKAETPAELAVSIIAELINHRASSTLITHD